MVVLLVAVTGLAVGFTRLDRVRRSPQRAAPAAPQSADAQAKDAETIRRCLDDLVRYLQEAETVSVTPTALPPLEELPSLPSEFLPEETAAASRL
jgi:hypothetical protein